jgi:hypothetical protein
VEYKAFVLEYSSDFSAEVAGNQETICFAGPELILLHFARGDELQLGHHSPIL